MFGIDEALRDDPRGARARARAPRTFRCAGEAAREFGAVVRRFDGFSRRPQAQRRVSGLHGQAREELLRRDPPERVRDVHAEVSAAYYSRQPPSLGSKSSATGSSMYTVVIPRLAGNTQRTRPLTDRPLPFARSQ